MARIWERTKKNQPINESTDLQSEEITRSSGNKRGYARHHKILTHVNTASNECHVIGKNE